MIVSLVTGGLGNQLSMYSFGRAFAKKRNDVHYIDIGQYEEKINPEHVYTLHKFSLNRTNLKINIITEEMLKDCSLDGLAVLGERLLRYDDTIWDVKNELMYIKMYAGDYRYSKPIIEELRKELTPMVPMTGEFAELYDEMRDGETVSVHVRLQDYIRNPNCFNLPLSYYMDAYKVVSNGASNLRVYLFTDEPEFMLRNGFRVDFPFTIISNGPDRNLEDMTLMTACKHHIVANSSFSFWGAWLDGKGSGITVVPDIYHKPDCKQLIETYGHVIQPEYPEDWNVVKIR